MDYYGCYVNFNHWQCKKFDTEKEATRYALAHPPTQVTRLIPISKPGMHQLDHVKLNIDLHLPVKINY